MFGRRCDTRRPRHGNLASYMAGLPPIFGPSRSAPTPPLEPGRIFCPSRWPLGRAVRPGPRRTQAHGLTTRTLWPTLAAAGPRHSESLGADVAGGDVALVPVVALPAPGRRDAVTRSD
jgi:hypothetical protein